MIMLLLIFLMVVQIDHKHKQFGLNGGNQNNILGLGHNKIRTINNGLNNISYKIHLSL